MTREKRIAIAQKCVGICQSGNYTTQKGHNVNLANDILKAVSGTVLYSAENPPKLGMATPRVSTTRFEVRNETTFSALARYAEEEGTVACLNFASAKNPGGGFLTGAQAQEESLARSSALYSCLLAAPQYYERNRANRSCLYLDQVIYSPFVPFLMNDEGDLIDKPILASVLTAPAPNAGAVAQNEPHNVLLVEPTLRRRTELVLNVALAHSVKHLVLGAWGCGVFRNNPETVARVFAEFLGPDGKFSNVFRSVIFAVYDRTSGEGTFRAFAEAFQGNGVPK